MKNIVITLLFVATLFSCDIADEDAISTQDLLLGKWQLEAFYINDILASLPNCKDLKTIEFQEEEAFVQEFKVDPNDETACINLDLIITDYALEGDTVSTSIPSDFGDIETIIILDISMSELKIETTVIINDIEYDLQEKYTKIN